jgi:hypothetical protein
MVWKFSGKGKKNRKEKKMKKVLLKCIHISEGMFDGEMNIVVKTDGGKDFSAIVRKKDIRGKNVIVEVHSEKTLIRFPGQDSTFGPQKIWVPKGALKEIKRKG